MDSRFKVVIIGAGLAGIGAGITFAENNINFTILEAMDRPGGRIETLQLLNGVIDLGAQWMHDTDNYPYQTMLEHDLVHKTTSNEGCGLYIRDDGFVFDEFLVKRVDFEVGRILEQCEKFVSSNEPPPHSLGEYLTEKFEECLQNYHGSDEPSEGQRSEDLKQQMRELFHWHIKFQLIDNSCRDLNLLSAKEWGRYSCLAKDGQKHINIKGGYRALVDILIKKLPPSSIQFNQVMQKIIICEETSSLTIFTQNGTIETDHVVITCSLGVLKNLDMSAVPLNPCAKQIIDKMGFDAMGKLFLEFDEHWWDWDGLQLIWSLNSTNWNGFPEWTKHISGFDCVLDQPNMLMAWVSHFGMKEIEIADNEDIGRHCAQLLRHFLPNVKVPFPRQVYKTTWFSNPFIRGGYGYVTNECENGKLPIGKVLSEAFWDRNKIPRVYLAGEALSIAHFSTTHGAFESGQLQAQHLCDFLNKP